MKYAMAFIALTIALGVIASFTGCTTTASKPTPKPIFAEPPPEFVSGGAE